MITLIAAAAIAAAQPAPAPAPQGQMASVQKEQGEGMKDCCKDCCKDMAGKEHGEHAAQVPSHAGHSTGK